MFSVLTPLSDIAAAVSDPVGDVGWSRLYQSGTDFVKWRCRRGVVFLQWRFSEGVAGGSWTAGTIPSAYAPANDIVVPAAILETNNVASVAILSTGVVKFWYAATGTVYGTTCWLTD